MAAATAAATTNITPSPDRKTNTYHQPQRRMSGAAAMALEEEEEEEEELLDMVEMSQMETSKVALHWWVKNLPRGNLDSESSRRLNTWINDYGHHGSYLLAHKEGQLIGFILLRDLYSNHSHYMVDLAYCLPEYRRNGIAHHLLDAAQDMLGGSKRTTLITYTRDDDHHNHYCSGGSTSTTATDLLANVGFTGTTSQATGVYLPYGYSLMAYQQQHPHLRTYYSQSSTMTHFLCMPSQQQAMEGVGH